jgi:EAL domain-containing protein (putative c-di-GMP-specific phosphodiesterase class I)
LNHLRRLPVEFLKIDKSFVADADEALESKTIIRAILAMAKSLGIKTIAEGIERPAQAVLLEELGCQIGQGYLYAKPLAYDKFLEFISSNR